MSEHLIRLYRQTDENDVVALSRRPAASPARGTTRAKTSRASPPSSLSGSSSLFKDDELIGSVMIGYDGHRGWVNYLAAASQARGLGIGRALMAEVERLLLEAGYPKLNVQVRGTNREALVFCEALGYTVEDVVSLWRNPYLVPDDVQQQDCDERSTARPSAKARAVAGGAGSARREPNRAGRWHGKGKGGDTGENLGLPP